MARSRKKIDGAPATTAQQLGSLVKSARDIMRKDKGLNGDLDRLPMLTWIMFLKFLDDMERLREQEAQLVGERFRPAIQKPYRWRDWAAHDGGITGPELIAFINQDEAVRPNGSRGPGLFAYLRKLQSAQGRGREEVIANVFRGVVNRMESGYLLRDVINKVDSIHFNSSEEIHTLSRLYESMLREMRDAAGDSGEFYTPRPVVQFMVAVTNPQLGETILDPACGTGGFLVETFDHLAKQCKTVQARRTLQRETLFGQEAKPLPYLLTQMNLLLHGLEHPRIDYGNSLAVKVTEIGDKERVDVILTNPPFGGEEEAQIKTNFPADMQTSDTALLFLQLIMRKLRRPEKNHGRPGRAAVVVPDGTLFNDGVCARIKGDLLREFNLHTVVRLPRGVFEPYTPIATNVLFFDRCGPTKDIWYYEQPLPEGRKKYTKTKPLQVDELKPLMSWWSKRRQTPQAWLVRAKDVIRYGANRRVAAVNLDIRNPRGVESLSRIEPTALIGQLLGTCRELVRICEHYQHQVGQITLGTRATLRIGDFATLVKRPWEPIAGEEVKSLGVRWWGKGAYIAEIKAAEKLRAARFTVRAGDLIYNDMWARHGSVAIVPEELDGCVASAHFPTWEIDKRKVLPEYLTWCFRSRWFWHECEQRSQGSTGL